MATLAGWLSAAPPSSTLPPTGRGATVPSTSPIRTGSLSSWPRTSRVDDPAGPDRRTTTPGAVAAPGLISVAMTVPSLPPAGVVRVVVDTDTYNEIDDQFAVVYALLSPERIRVEALYAAPFHNQRSTGPEDGMHKSYDELLRLLERLPEHRSTPVHHGSGNWLAAADRPLPSPAATDLVERAGGTDGPLYVVTLGAPTNVASALLAAAAIADSIVGVWRG